MRQCPSTSVRLSASTFDLAGDIVLPPLPLDVAGGGYITKRRKAPMVGASEKKLGEMRREMRGFKKLSPDGN